MLATCLGNLFDLSQVAVSLADEATNIMVAIAFFEQGQATFFGLVLAVLIISSIISSTAFVIRVEKKLPCRPDSVCGWITAVAVFVPFGVLLPALNFCLTKISPDMDKNFGIDSVEWGDQFDKDAVEKKKEEIRKRQAAREKQIESQRRRFKIEEGDSDAQKNQKERILGQYLARIKEIEQSEREELEGATASGAAAELANDVAQSTEAMKILDDSLVRRFGSFFILNIQALCSSSIQAIIQLVAASIAAEGKPTTIQTISLLLSLTSVAMKSYQVARSGTVAAMFWKISTMSFDLFATVFVFSFFLTAFVPEDDKTLDLFGATNATVLPLSGAWIYTKASCAFLDLIAALIAFYIVLTSSSYDRCLKFWMCIGGFFLLAPLVLLAQDVVKLSYLLLLHHKGAPSSSNLPYVAFLHAFLWNAPGEGCRSCACDGDSDLTRPEAVDWRATFEALRVRALALLDRQYEHVKLELERRKEEDRKFREENKKEQQDGGKSGNDDDDDDDDGSSIAVPQFGGRQRGPPSRWGRNGRRYPGHPSPSSPQSPLDQHLPLQFLASLPQDSRINPNLSHLTALRSFQVPAQQHHEVLDDALARTRFLFLISRWQALWQDVRHMSQRSTMLGQQHTAQGLLGSIDTARSRLNRIIDETLDTGACHAENYRSFASIGDFSSAYSLMQKRNARRLNQDPLVGQFRRSRKSTCESLCDDICRVCRNLHKEPEAVAAILVFLSCFISTTMGTLFPIIATAMYASDFTSLQMICSALCLGSLLLMILLTPAMIRYQRTCNVSQGDTIYRTQKDFPRIIDTFSSLPLNLLPEVIFAEQKEAEEKQQQQQQQDQEPAVKSAFLLPEDAFALHVLPFVDPRSVGLYGLKRSEYRELNHGLRKMMYKREHGGGGGGGAAALGYGTSAAVNVDDPPSAAAAEGAAETGLQDEVSAPLML